MREWCDDIEFRDDGPYLSTGRFTLFLTYLMLTGALSMMVLGMLLIVLFAAVGIYTGEYGLAVRHIFVPLGFTLIGLAAVRFSQSPYRWRKLRAAFDASLVTVAGTLDDATG